MPMRSVLMLACIIRGISAMGNETFREFGSPISICLTAGTSKGHCRQDSQDSGTLDPAVFTPMPILPVVISLARREWDRRQSAGDCLSMGRRLGLRVCRYYCGNFDGKERHTWAYHKIVLPTQRHRKIWLTNMAISRTMIFPRVTYIAFQPKKKCAMVLKLVESCTDHDTALVERTIALMSAITHILIWRVTIQDTN